MPLASEPYHHVGRHDLVLVQHLLCFVSSSELLQCFYYLMVVHVVLVYLQTSMTCQVDQRTHKVAKHFLNGKLLTLSPIKDPTIYFADINEIPKDFGVLVFGLC